MMERFPGYQMSMGEVGEFIQSSGDHHFKVITLSGGEPLLWEHLEEGVARLREAKIADRIEIFSNGTLPRRFTSALMSNVDLLRLSFHGFNEVELRALKRLWPNKVDVVDRRNHHIGPPTALFSHHEVLPATCSSTGWMIYGGWAFACCAVTSVIANCKLNMQDYPVLTCKVEPGYLQKLAPYVPACYELCCGCTANHKVRLVMEKNRQ